MMVESQKNILSKALHSEDFFVNSIMKRLQKLVIITKLLIMIIMAIFD